MRRSDIEASVRLKYGDPEEVVAYSDSVAQGLTLYEQTLVHCAFTSGQRVLDVGCGGGREAASMARSGLQVVAMDLLPVMVQAARQCSRAMALPVSCLVGNVIALPFREACFDGAVMLAQIIAFVPGRDRRVAALRSVWSVLRPGGKLVMTTHNRRCHWKFRLYFAWSNRVRRLARRLGYDGGLGDYDRWSPRISQARTSRPVFFHMYDLEEAIADLKAVGFEVLDARARAEFEAGCVDLALRERDYVLGFIAKRPEA